MSSSHTVTAHPPIPKAPLICYSWVNGWAAPNPPTLTQIAKEWFKRSLMMPIYNLHMVVHTLLYTAPVAMALNVKVWDEGVKSVREAYATIVGLFRLQLPLNTQLHYRVPSRR